jgi:hypothetical protein
LGKQRKLKRRFKINEHQLMYYFRYIMLVIYFVALIPVYLLIHFVCAKYELDILIFMIVFLSYLCVHLLFYPKYKNYFILDD